MKQISFQQILIAASAPLALVAMVTWCISMIKHSEINGIGIIVAIYYFIPALLFSFLFASFINFLNRHGLLFLSSTLIGQAIVSLVLLIVLLSLWVLFDRGPGYHEMGFRRYWWLQLKLYWFSLIFFAMSIPLTFYIVRNR
jgi:hypothetical protein